VVHDRRYLVVGADTQVLGRELLAAQDIDRHHAIRQLAFLQHDRGLDPVRRRKVIQVDHETVATV
jgi:hypothetical protein